MNAQRIQIRKLTIYEFELVHITTETTKNICCVNGEGAVDHITVIKFHLGCKNLNDRARSGKPKTVDSEAVFQAIEANLRSIFQRSIMRVSGELGWLPSRPRQKHSELTSCVSDDQNIIKLLIHPSNRNF